VPVRQVSHPPTHLPGVAAVLLGLDGEAALFYRVRPPLLETTPLTHLCSTPATEGAFSRLTGIIGSSLVCLHVHVRSSAMIHIRTNRG